MAALPESNMPWTPGPQGSGSNASRQWDGTSSGVRSSQDLTAALDKHPQQEDMNDSRTPQEREAVDSILSRRICQHRDRWGLKKTSAEEQGWKVLCKVWDDLATYLG